MQRAFIAGAILAVLLAMLGIFVTLRKMAFFGDGIAHSSLAGIAIAVLVGFAPLPVALLWALFIAVLIYWLERSTRLPSDSLIGIFFTASMALGVILMSLTNGYRPELLSYLFGSILSIQNVDLLTTAIVAAIILIWLIASFRQLTFLALAEDAAIVSGVPYRVQTIALYIALALATVLGVKMLGIILVSALLIIPPATSRMLTHSFKGYVVGALVLGLIAVLIGLTLSYTYDLPSGASIILTGTALFFVAAIVGKKA